MRTRNGKYRFPTPDPIEVESPKSLKVEVKSSFTPILKSQPAVTRSSKRSTSVQHQLPTPGRSSPMAGSTTDDGLEDVLGYIRGVLSCRGHVEVVSGNAEALKEFYKFLGEGKVRSFAIVRINAKSHSARIEALANAVGASVTTLHLDEGKTLLTTTQLNKLLEAGTSAEKALTNAQVPSAGAVETTTPTGNTLGIYDVQWLLHCIGPLLGEVYRLGRVTHVSAKQNYHLELCDTLSRQGATKTVWLLEETNGQNLRDISWSGFGIVQAVSKFDDFGDLDFSSDSELSELQSDDDEFVPQALDAENKDESDSEVQETSESEDDQPARKRLRSQHKSIKSQGEAMNATNSKRISFAAHVPLKRTHDETSGSDPKKKSGKNFNLRLSGTAAALTTRNQLPPRIRDNADAIINERPELVAGELLLWMLSINGGRKTTKDVHQALLDRARVEQRANPGTSVTKLTRSTISHRKKVALQRRAAANGTNYEDERADFDAELYRAPTVQGALVGSEAESDEPADGSARHAPEVSHDVGVPGSADLPYGGHFEDALGDIDTSVEVVAEADQDAPADINAMPGFGNLNDVEEHPSSWPLDEDLTNLSDMEIRSHPFVNGRIWQVTTQHNGESFQSNLTLPSFGASTGNDNVIDPETNGLQSASGQWVYPHQSVPATISSEQDANLQLASGQGNNTVHQSVPSTGSSQASDEQPRDQLSEGNGLYAAGPFEGLPMFNIDDFLNWDWYDDADNL